MKVLLSVNAVRGNVGGCGESNYRVSKKELHLFNGDYHSPVPDIPVGVGHLKGKGIISRL